MSDVESTLDEVRGAPFERPALVLAEALLERAERAGSGASRLRERAAGVLERASARIAAARERADADVAAAAAREAPRVRAVEDRLARAGELAGRRGLRIPAHLRRRATEATSADLTARAARKVAAEAAEVLGRHLFRETLHAARIQLAVARAQKGVADDVGHYNSQGLAARVLELMEALSPTYLRTYLAALDDLASLSRLPEVKRSTRKRG